MQIKNFALERYFSKYEFSAPYLLCCSDCEPLTLKELLSFADKSTLKLWEDLWLGYTESQGHPLLRKEITTLYKSIHQNEVLITAPEEGIFIAMNTLLSKNDNVIVTFPGYQSLYEIAKSIGCEITQWEPDSDWHFDIDILKKLIKTNTKMIVINFPHNPTGAQLNQKEFEEILQLAKKNNIIIFSDEMYRFLEYNQNDCLPSASDLYENAISLFGMSKTFGLAGLRIGWLTTKNKVFFQKFANFKDYTTICSSAPSEILAIIAIKAKNLIIKRNLEIIEKNLQVLDEFFKKYSNIFNWKKPKAGPIGFPQLLLPIKIDEFCLDLVNKKGVMILPSTVYDFKSNNFRIGFGRKNLKTALHKFEEYLEEKKYD
jgi:aspartate/methionine/tyrosine aminotransferase